MERELVEQAVRPHGMPPDLRVVWEGWRRGALSRGQLDEAGYRVALDYLPEYRWRPLPEMPRAIREFRELSEAERKVWKVEQVTELHRQHEAALKQESAARSRNASNRQWLEQLLAWAKASALDPGITARIEHGLMGHRANA